MAARPDLENDQEFWDDLRSSMKKVHIMEKWNCSSSFVVDRRKKLHRRNDTENGSVATRASEAIRADNRAFEYVNDTHDPEKGDSYTRMADTAWGEEDWREFLRLKGTDPDSVTFSFGVTSNPPGGYWNKLLNVRPKTDPKDSIGPEWPVVQRAAPVVVEVTEAPSRPTRRMFKMSLKGADTQIGFRAVGDGYESFHDEEAMALFVEIARREQPEEIVILGDFLDLPSQGRWAQEAGFARTTQMALDVGYRFLARLRTVCPDAIIILIEGNHDKRMQTFIEQNALAAFGLKRAGMPESWPTMSLPFLLRLDELGVEYMDAYPAAVYWDDDNTRNIHGTKANSKGSTMAQYSNDLPHINTWAGHTHRAEIIYKTVMGPRGEAIESYSANPGCLCRTDGSVPGVHSGSHLDGSSAKVICDWQQGFGVNLFDGEGNSWPQVYRIKNGKAVYKGEVIDAEPL